MGRCHRFIRRSSSYVLQKMTSAWVPRSQQQQQCRCKVVGEAQRRKRRRQEESPSERNLRASPLLQPMWSVLRLHRQSMWNPNKSSVPERICQSNQTTVGKDINLTHYLEILSYQQDLILKLKRQKTSTKLIGKRLFLRIT